MNIRVSRRAVEIAAVGVFMLGYAAIQAGAATDEVFSVNVVGFQKVAALSNKQILVSMPFSADSYDINQVVGGQLVAGKNDASADKILFWDVTLQQYKTFYLRTKAGTITNKWVELGGNEDIPATNGLLRYSSGAWLLKPAGIAGQSNQTVILCGDVVNMGAVTTLVYGTSAGYMNLISYPYSTPVGINAMRLTNGVAGKNDSASDRLYAWDAASQSYVTYYFRTKAGTITNRWVVNSGNEDVPATNMINPQEAFWYIGKTNFTWIAVRPYTL